MCINYIKMQKKVMQKRYFDRGSKYHNALPATQNAPNSRHSLQIVDNVKKCFIQRIMSICHC